MESRLYSTTFSNFQPEFFAPFSFVKPVIQSIEKTANFIPGLVTVQDYNTRKPVYINQYGCDFFKLSKSALLQMGENYQTNFFFPEEEAFLQAQIEELFQSNRTQKSLSFFQRIKPSKTGQYSWFFTTSQYFPNYSDAVTPILHISLPVNNCSYMGKKLDQLTEENLFIQNNYKKFKRLTLREKEILQFISEGKCSQKIADLLYISIHTVNNHRKNIIKKLGKKKLSTFIKLFPAFS
ncbi:helix-turn-helix domain-containing protein [Haloflavibacter putidus]|uniref:HTH luxR-type domain-containing protein n=1 Tax=Haloflavibacter putidus TaxID=2576776 RepID=A0A508A1K2_9FLAO|nr:LuxR C-terminal-related transcriptional regulator [Haloflavibacter putidus]TQD39702.1 hypothetical protein FKR84_04195 [Haloflavibacter putidus]